jgi:4'-phosphopantetheinyl transferase
MVRLEDLAIGEMVAVLSRSERKRAEQIRHHEPWRQFVLTRGFLRLMIAQYADCPQAAIDIVDGEGEAPRLVDNPRSINFSVSHSCDWSAIAVGTRPLGIDIERINQEGNWRQIADLCFHEDELAFLQAVPPEKRVDAFFDIWCRKEALLKASGEGFRADPTRFSTVPFDRAVCVKSAGETGESWYMRSLPAPHGYKAAMAGSGPSREVIRVDAANVAARRPGAGLQRQSKRPTPAAGYRPALQFS